MGLFNYLFYLTVEPLKLLFEVVFFYAFKLTNHAGLSIVVMSLAVNFLVLPLYIRADVLQKQSNDKEAEIRPMSTHIKKCFHGDEKMMMLNTYYSQMHYSPLNSLKSSISLFLQIPFFIAAYSFLSGLKMLQGISLGPIQDLGAPDALIRIGALSINLLPILMTVINIISSFIYSEKGMIKEKVKLVLMALVFLVLLYGSPSGLVFYWTLNNIFSLGKNIVFHYNAPKVSSSSSESDKSGRVLLIISLVVLTLLTGLMIPADVVSENPTELVNSFSAAPHNPALYLLTSSLIATGLFMIWVPIFYFLAGDKLRKILTYAFVSWSFVGIFNYVLCNKNFGMLSRKLIYDHEMTFDVRQTVINILIDAAFVTLTVLLIQRSKKMIKALCLISLVAITILSFINLFLIIFVTINKNYDYHEGSENINAPLTTTGQNVIVIMMDRMMSAYLPYIVNERPEILEQLDGFTFYPNTVSFGTHTNFAAPALYGGYEYTPDRLNARSDELLVDKHNEALRVLPTIFADNGWTVSVGDPSYANYEWIPDVSIYDDNDNINAFRMAGMFNDQSDLLTNAGDEIEMRLNRNFFCYGIMKTLPYLLQPSAYSGGSYNNIDLYYEGYVDDTYIGTTPHTQIGLFESYVEEFAALESLDLIVDITDDPNNCFFMFANNTTHEYCLLEEPEYLPAVIVNNTEFDAANEDRFTLNGVTVHMDTDFLNYSAYECNMAALISLGNWFDFLRANDLYDNSRIILVADHAYGMAQFDDLLVADPEFDAQWVNPILLVKDFGSTGFTVNYDFMTNADTPFLTLNGVITDPVNPFTGNPIVENDKTDDQLIYISEEWNVNSNSSTHFEDPNDYWLTVRNNIWDDENWSYYDANPA